MTFAYTPLPLCMHHSKGQGQHNLLDIADLRLEYAAPERVFSAYTSSQLGKPPFATSHFIQSRVAAVKSSCNLFFPVKKSK